MMILRLRTKLLIFISIISATAFPQNPLGEVIFSANNTKYLGQYSDGQNDRNGFGISNEGSGRIYVGNFSRNKFNGRGMLIAENLMTIGDIKDCYVYIGGWLKGKKQGKGTCYAFNGDILYSGKFANDVPVESSDAQDSIDKYFSIIDSGDGLFAGELITGEPNGFGLSIQEDGTYWIGNWKEGEKNGLGLLIFGPNNWKQVSYKEGEMKEISSSQDYANRKENNKAVNKGIMRDFWKGMGEVATGLLGVASNFKSHSSTNQESNPNEDIAGTKSKSHKQKSSTAKNSKKANCGTAWMSDSRVYSDYETQLIKGDCSNPTDVRNKMKQIRTKWEKRGCPITKSPYE